MDHGLGDSQKTVTSVATMEATHSCSTMMIVLQENQCISYTMSDEAVRMTLLRDLL